MRSAARLSQPSSLNAPRGALLCLAAVLVFTPAAWARDPSKISPEKRNEPFAPSETITPDKKAVEKNESLQDKRFTAPDPVERKQAPVGERRAPFELKEKRDKKLIDRKDAPKPDVREREMNRFSDKKSLIQPNADGKMEKYGKVSKYQANIKDAPNSGLQKSPTLQKRTTFDRINRFVFRRNGPGEGDNTGVTRAGEGAIAAPTPAPASPANDASAPQAISTSK